MPITITWNDGVAAATTFVMPDDVVASLDQFRQTVTQFDAATQALVVIYPTVQAMIVGLFVKSIVMPALARFPTAAIAAATAARRRRRWS